MALPIKSTPTLKGKDAKRFIEKTKENETKIASENKIREMMKPFKRLALNIECFDKRKLTIGARDYEINFVMVPDGADENYGLINYDWNKIDIKKGLLQGTACITVLHEILHALARVSGMKMEEANVVAMSEHIYKMFRDNGKFMGEFIDCCQK